MSLIGCWHSLEAAAPLAGINDNEHGTEAPEGSWRKPSPTMLLEASRDLNLDLKKSLLVGDRLSDLEAGARAGVETLIHVLTGHGQSERAPIKAWRKREHEGSSENPKPELCLMDTLVAFPNSLFRQST